MATKLHQANSPKILTAEGWRRAIFQQTGKMIVFTAVPHEKTKAESEDKKSSR
ncbi:MAG: hypothetical protein JSR80_06635 [Verrucomicrobia bacterium]|nr:hypothetical protein [Verrucomicrobiota bacterium]